MRSRPAIGATLACIGALTLGATAPTAAAPGPAQSSGSAQSVEVHNPISDPFSDTYADPAVIRGKDGYWYLYATSDPLTEAPSDFGLMHIARTQDFSEWEYLGEVFDEESRPTWATESSLFWAPDIRYVDGQYVMYYTATDTVADPGQWNYAIGAATAPTPHGPWTATDEAVVDPRPDGNGGYFNTIDPALLTDDDGRRYLYFGGYHGGIWVAEVDETGLRAVGDPVQVTVADRYEGAFVVKRDGYYYLTASSANCCAGPVTGYSVYAGRSNTPWGPFVDHEGVSMADSRVGGTQVLAQNGNSVIGVGHHAFFSDTTGQDWILYHGIERDDAWLDAPGGINERPTFIDRLDWIDGWPLAAAGAGPTEGTLTGPTTGSGFGITMDDPASSTSLRTVSGSWRSVPEELNDAGAVGLLEPTADPARVESRRPLPRESRIEADVRFPDGTGSLTVEWRRAGPHSLGVEVDADANELRVWQGSPRDSADAVTDLPETFDPEAFTALIVESRDGVLHARLEESRLGDPLAEVRLATPAAMPRRHLAVTATEGPVQIDNLSVAQVHQPVTEAVATPQPGAALFTEEFEGTLAPGWSWVREQEDVTIDDGALHWPLTSTDVVGAGNTGPLLLREAPEGDWIMETELTLDLGENTIRNYQQAGLIVHADDDNLLRLGDVALHSTRQVEFGKEMSTAGRLDWGAHLSGPTATTMWLRLHHSTDPDTGELRYRSASSTDGENWRWGATWTLPAGSEPQVGLYAGGGSQPATVAEFESVSFYDVAD
ncbi:family 43 glycosylhydrolase [Ruania halotolerans]|uniref:family 43 glycosylhydrolase n=1 Tax=Ruania halotolerans TaxID=2897773 RepID=UPI001E590372|nr:family 43 glycosylhydrolase [Ruania halotolerans]UFU07244.1 family 43 glycosylhydrolase [Ruania halotolerans]